MSDATHLFLQQEQMRDFASPPLDILPLLQRFTQLHQHIQHTLNTFPSAKR